MPTFECSKCGETFDNGDELAEHIREVHQSDSAPSFECSICDERFSSESDLIAHMAAAHPSGS